MRDSAGQVFGVGVASERRVGTESLVVGGEEATFLGMWARYCTCRYIVTYFYRLDYFADRPKKRVCSETPWEAIYSVEPHTAVL